MPVVDWSDPCARYEALRNAYYTTLSGGSETLIRKKGPESEQEVRYHAQDTDMLKAEMNAAQAECAAQNGTPNKSRRFAIRAGATRWPRGC